MLQILKQPILLATAVTVLFVLLLAMMSAPWRGASNAPTAVDGFLQADQWDIDEAPIRLAGSWQVVWNEILEPAEFDAKYAGELFSIPGRWNELMGAKGAATFRLHLDVADDAPPLALHTISPHSSWRLYAGDRLLAANGVPSANPEHAVPHYVSRMAELPPGDVVLLLQVSNHGHAYGGPGHAPTLWNAANLSAFLDSLSAIYAIVLGVLLTLALLHFVIYFSDGTQRTGRSAHLWMGVLCVILVYRIGGVVPLLHLHFPDADMYGNLRITYISLFAAPIVFLMFFRSLFTDRVPKGLAWTMTAACSLCGLICLFAPEIVFTRLRNFAITLNVLTVAYTSFVAWRAALQQEAGALTVLVTNLAFLVTAINDAVVYTDQQNGVDLTPMGILALSIGYSWALRQRLQRTLREAEQASEAIEALNLQLEGEVEERTRAFRAATARAESLAEERARFIAAASHDLRQPLHALALFNSALQRRTAGSDLESMIDKQNASIESLSAMLQDTLDAARMDAQTIQPKLSVIDLEALIARLVADFEGKANDRNVSLTANACRGTLSTDASMLRRIVGNVIDNAIKAARTSVTITARASNAEVTIDVDDDGPGIAPADAARILEPYVSLPGDEFQQGGYGLGLHVANRFITTLKGRLKIARADAGGARVSLTLPADEGAESTAVRPPNRTPVVAGLRVLAVDDDPEVREGLVAMLGTWGCEVRASDRCRTALHLLADGWQPHALLVDFHLPESDGVATVEQLRQILGGSVPALVITGATEPEITARIDAAGLPKMSKPIQPSDLAAWLENQRAAETTPRTI